MQSDELDAIGLAEYVRMLKRRWWLLAPVPLLVAAATYGLFGH